MRRVLRPILTALLLLTVLAAGDLWARRPPKMRPYAGIGVVMIRNADATPPIYEEPGLSRIGQLDMGRLPRHENIFGGTQDGHPAIVSASRGEWLKIVYDDAGREGWIASRKSSDFTTWDIFLKGALVRLLPGLRKGHYQLHQQPGRSPGAAISPKTPLRVVKLDQEWAMVMPSHDSIGWVRWKDEDGMILVGLDRPDNK